MENFEARTHIIDEEHLKLLSLFHYIKGAITLAFSFLAIIYLLFLSVLFDSIGTLQHQPLYHRADFPFDLFSTIMFFVWVIMLLVVVFGILQIVSGYYLKQKKHRLFSFIVGVFQLIEIPYGTILGIMTIIVLSRNSVEQQYQAQLPK